MFKKVWRGSLQLAHLHGPGAPLGAHAAVLGALPDQAVAALPAEGPLPVRALWDIAAGVHALRGRQKGRRDAAAEAAQALHGAALQQINVSPAAIITLLRYFSA
jgi:hypothetical protein